ncbi:MAG TPA: tetratricopeptide repeat-containing protein, partial [Verrucomicrobiae bacterium]|nr:tetratricopeptide repeat-containing protein [Verrucomicrobiae bacterium]
LRARWNATFAKTPAFPFVAVAGETDEFVPRESSIDPFPEDKRAVVPGNHIEMVKPDGPGDESVALVAAGLRGTKLPWSRWAGAWIAVQQGEFQKVIDDLLPDCDSLDERSAVSLALALDAVKRRDEAISVLQKRRPEETDAMGVLAGRIKRRWRASGKLDEGEHALAIYADALRRSHLAGNARQESYHAINVAFLTLALHDDLPAAQGMAREALTACARAPEDLWRAATEGEANLILGEDDAALEHYRRAMARSSKPWEIESMFTQAYTLASGLLKRKKTSGRLEELFGRRVEL